MSQKSSILKSQNSESSSTKKKRVSWGNSKILKFFAKEASGLEELESSSGSDEFSAESPILTPVLLFPNSGAPEEHNISFLSPVVEVDERLIATESSNNLNYSYMRSAISPPKFKDLHWKDWTCKKTVKSTPRKNFNTENIVNEAREALVRCKAELEIIQMQRTYALEKNQEISESIREQRLSIEEELNEGRVMKEIMNEEYKKRINESNCFNEKQIVDVPVEDRYFIYSVLLNNSYAKVYRHKTTVLDNQDYAYLSIIFTAENVKIALKVPFFPALQSIWDHYKVYLENTLRGTEQQIIRNISNAWCGFLKFSNSFEKLLLISNIISVDFSEVSVLIKGHISNFHWEFPIEFQKFDSNIDIFAEVFKSFSNL